MATSPEAIPKVILLMETPPDPFNSTLGSIWNVGICPDDLMMMNLLKRERGFDRVTDQAWFLRSHTLESPIQAAFLAIFSKKIWWNEWKRIGVWLL